MTLNLETIGKYDKLIILSTCLKLDQLYGKKGSAVVLTASQVKRKLKSIHKASDFKIGDVPLVKDSETRHFQIAGNPIGNE